MPSGRLTVKKGTYYAVLFISEGGGKGKEKWICLKVPEKRGLRKAQGMLDILKADYDPNNPVQIERTMAKIGLGIRPSQNANPGRVDSDDLFTKARGGSILFSDYMRLWLEKVRPTLEQTTFGGYEKCIRALTPYFKTRGVRLEDISPDDIEDFYSYEGATHKGSTVVRFHVIIREALQYAFKKGIILTNPADRVDRPKSEPYMAEFYNIDEMKDLLKKVHGTKLEFAVLMACHYGLRREEIVGLKWDAIDFQYKTLTIRHTVTVAQIGGHHLRVAKDRAKSKKSLRTLPLFPVVENFLLDMHEKQEGYKKLFGNTYNHKYDEYIYVDPDGRLVDPDWISKNFPVFLKANGLKHIRFHDLRHSCATMLRHQGVAMEDIQKWLGHSTITTTEAIYAHFDDRKHIDSANKISDAFGEREIDEEDQKKPEMK
jgi:integrase